jgi:hypothetical protein
LCCVADAFICALVLLQALLHALVDTARVLLQALLLVLLQALLHALVDTARVLL